ncbi:MAG: hypothetical protein ACFFC7_25780, partial [Candidatus Hermodarchaeota archaeon]
SCSSSGILKISDILGWVHFQRSGDTVKLLSVTSFPELANLRSMTDIKIKYWILTNSFVLKKNLLDIKMRHECEGEIYGIKSCHSKAGDTITKFK